MLMPSIFARDFFDDVFDSQFYGNHSNSDLMKTDVKETDQGYELTMDLPGVKKEDLHAQLQNGYLTIGATTNQSNDQTDSNGKYIRRERFSGTFSRSFYVGDGVTQDEIRARYQDGTLTLFVPKKDRTKQVENQNFIAIEG